MQYSRWERSSRPLRYHRLRYANIAFLCLCPYWCRMPTLIRKTLGLLCPPQDVTQFVSDPTSSLANKRSCNSVIWKQSWQESSQHNSDINVFRWRCIYINWKLGWLGYVCNIAWAVFNLVVFHILVRAQSHALNHIVTLTFPLSLALICSIFIRLNI